MGNLFAPVEFFFLCELHFPWTELKSYHISPKKLYDLFFQILPLLTELIIHLDNF